MTTMRYGEISLTLPADWQDASQILAVGPEIAGFRPNLAVTFEAAADPAEDAADYAERTLPTVRRMIGNLKVVSEDHARIGGSSGYLREQTMTLGGRNLIQLQFFTRRGGRFFTFTLTHLAEEAEDARALAQKLFAQAHIAGAAEQQPVKVPGAGTIRS